MTSSQKRVLILYADYGFGHRSASKAIAQALEEIYGEACHVDLVNPLEDPRAPTFLRDQQEDYDRIVRENPRFYKLTYDLADLSLTTNLVESALIVMLFEAMRDVLEKYNPDVVVCTYLLFHAPLAAIYTMEKTHIPLVTVVTDLATVQKMWFHPAVDLCMVPTQKVYDLALENGLPVEKIKLTGLPVNPKLAQKDKNKAELKKSIGWKSDVPVLLAVGSKRVGKMPEALHLLNHSGLPIQLAIVAGGDEEMFQQYKRTDWHIPTTVYNFVDDMSTFLLAADLLLCKAGGLITTEGLACGLPLVLVDVIEGQETGNAAFIIEGGAGVLAEKPAMVLETVFHCLMQDGKELHEYAARASQLGRPRAAFEVAEYVWQAAERGTQKRINQSRLDLPALIDLLTNFEVPWRRD